MKNKTYPILAVFLFTSIAANAADVNATAAGGGHSLFLKTDGSLWVVGQNDAGQLGDGTTSDKNLTVRILDANVTAVAAGHQHSLILKNDGSVWSFGANDSGQLGDGTTTLRSSPVKIENSGVSALSAGYAFNLFLKADGFRLRGMGENQYGQLGDGTTMDRNESISYDDNSTAVSAVSAGGNHSLWKMIDGTLRSVGHNLFGQLGDQSNADRTGPVVVFGATDVTTIAAGDEHSLFLKNDNTLWGMGDNQWGQLGDDSDNDRNQSALIDSNVTSVAAGLLHSLYVKSDGSLWAMGGNEYGQLGDGTTEDRSTPVKIVDSGVSSVSSSSSANHSFFFKTDGSLWAMGRNHKGQLGDGTTTDRSTPVLINKTLTLNKVGDGAVSGAGSYLTGETITVTATPDPGYLFMGWTGDFNSTSSSDQVTTSQVTISGNMEINATFYQQTALLHVQNNPGSYNLYTEVEKNASVQSARNDAFKDGNDSGIAYVQANPGTYNLFTSTEKAAAETAAKATGVTEGLATVQADMATQGLSLVTYLDKISAKPHTYNWYYQPEWGWLWTNEENFPFVYKASSGETPGTWLYFSQLSDQPAASFYDYSQEKWVTIAE